jgi:hypothetical protein
MTALLDHLYRIATVFSALQHYWITYIEMQLLLEFKNIMELLVERYGVVAS